VLAAANLTDADLFDDTPSNGQKQILATYDYHDEHRKLLYQVVRFAPKDFRQRTPQGTGWSWKLNGVRRVLYRLAELHGQARVFIVEGEKDADRLWALGLPATTNAGGAGKWRDEYSAQLHKAGVQRAVILPDNDDPGRLHASTVAASLQKHGIKPRTLILADLAEKGDVSDWLAAGHTIAQLESYLAAEPEPAPQAPPAILDKIRPASVFLAEAIPIRSWLVDGVIPTGGIVMMIAKPKVGKSVASRALAVALAQGTPWLGYDCILSSVWYLALEGDPIEPRRHFQQLGLQAHDPLSLFVDVQEQDLVGQFTDAAAHAKPALIIIDTLQPFIRAKDMNDYAETSKLMTALKVLVDRSGAALLLIYHGGKAADRAVTDATLGSTALAAGCDNVIQMQRYEPAGYRTIRSVNRIGAEMPERIIEYDESSGRVRLGGSRNEREITELAHTMLEALRDSPEPMTQRDWFSVAGQAKTDLKTKAKRRLERDGLVAKSGSGKRGTVERFRIRDANEPEPAKEAMQAALDDTAIFE
jgi:5S rRNA maturation endonuclease (ribonuclease M5)